MFSSDEINGENAFPTDMRRILKNLNNFGFLEQVNENYQIFFVYTFTITKANVWFQDPEEYGVETLSPTAQNYATDKSKKSSLFLRSSRMSKLKGKEINFIFAVLADWLNLCVFLLQAIMV